jgi:hypothetical protein
VISKGRHQQALSAINADHPSRGRPRIPNLGFSCTLSTVFRRKAAYCRVAIVTYRSLCLGISLPGGKADLFIVFVVSSWLNTGATRGILTHLGNWGTGEDRVVDPRNDFMRTKRRAAAAKRLFAPSTLVQRARYRSGTFSEVIAPPSFHEEFGAFSSFWLPYFPSGLPKMVAVASKW